MAIYMLFDNPADKQNMTFLKEYETAVIQHVYPEQKCNSTKEMLSVCKEIIKKSADGDTIIFWYDFMAVLCWWLCKVQSKRRKIITVNILLKDKNTTKNKLAKFLYKPALKLKDVQATVTSRKYGEHLNEMLGLHKKYVLLYDIYHGGYSFDYKGDMNPNTVFCSGRNGRNWDFLIEIAEVMPEVTFNCVIPKDKWEQHKDSFSSNMVVKSDIPEKEFLEFMCQSQLVVMPLDTEAPAGLIAFYQATANGKMSITFVCFLLENKKRAWIAFGCALIYNFVCVSYFFDETHIADRASVNFNARTNILYCAVYFIAGGLIFLYWKELAEFAQKHKAVADVILLATTVAYFVLGSSTITMLFFCVAALAYTLGCNRGGQVNPVAKFLGGICFEIYLCHMVIYRVLE